jgi:hypothetical protein
MQKEEQHGEIKDSDAEPGKTPRKAEGGRNAVKKPALRPGERGLRKEGVHKEREPGRTG